MEQGRFIIAYNDVTQQNVIIDVIAGRIIGSCEDYIKEQEQSAYPPEPANGTTVYVNKND